MYDPTIFLQQISENSATIFLLIFLLVKQNPDAQFLVTFYLLQEVILHYYYLFPYHLYCFLNFFEYPLLSKELAGNIAQQNSRFTCINIINTFNYHETFHDVYVDHFKASCTGISGFPIVGGGLHSPSYDVF